MGWQFWQATAMQMETAFGRTPEAWSKLQEKAKAPTISASDWPSAQHTPTQKLREEGYERCFNTTPEKSESRSGWSKRRLAILPTQHRLPDPEESRIQFKVNAKRPCELQLSFYRQRLAARNAQSAMNRKVYLYWLSQNQSRLRGNDVWSCTWSLSGEKSSGGWKQKLKETAVSHQLQIRLPSDLHIRNRDLVPNCKQQLADHEVQVAKRETVLVKATAFGWSCLQHCLNFR